MRSIAHRPLAKAAVESENPRWGLPCRRERQEPPRAPGRALADSTRAGLELPAPHAVSVYLRSPRGGPCRTTLCYARASEPRCHGADLRSACDRCPCPRARYARHFTPAGRGVSPYLVKKGTRYAQIGEAGAPFGRVEMEQLLVAANQLVPAEVPILPGMRLDVPAVVPTA